MYILIDKENKKGFFGKDRRVISKKSGVSENTLKWYLKKGDYHENMKHIFFKTDPIIGKKGGKRIKKEEQYE
jgi:hypothetical protein